MSPGKMHAEEVDIDISLARRLLRAQFPEWAALPLFFLVFLNSWHVNLSISEESHVQGDEILRFSQNDIWGELFDKKNT
ncbi:MAG TPA: hypothetical protein VEH81_15530 [Ktedonobacteraceae bacterium]|nr:hypothetical protein [Ktedonobacteraceae bacterium]